MIATLSNGLLVLNDSASKCAPSPSVVTKLASAFKKQATGFHSALPNQAGSIKQQGGWEVDRGGDMQSQLGP